MPYEFFDDVAFYFVVCSIVFTFVAPWTAYKIYCMVYTGSSRHKEDDPLCLCEDCSKKFKKVALPEGKSFCDYVTFSNALFCFMWLLLIILMIQLPNFQSEELHSFQPFHILGIEPDATESQIKKAYRSESLKWHPDRNPDNPEAHQQFIMVAKAYETLTDPKAKENLEKFGNPDGYKGASVTIGLPSVLTKKENELAILLLYFLVLIVVPPIAVWMWWSKAKDLHSSGIYRETITIFFRFTQDNMAPKFLIELLAAAVENRPLAETTTSAKDLTKLENQIKGHKAKQKWGKKVYVVKATALLYGYILRVDIPEAMKSDLSFVLKDVHRLLNVLLEITFARKFHATMISCIRLMQSLTQALWFDSDPLLQLPHLDEREIRRLRVARSTVSSIDRFKKLSHEQREKLCPDLTPDQWKDIDDAAARLPSIHVKANHSVEGEEGVYVGDIVTVSIDMTRMTTDEVVNGIVKVVKEEVEEEEEELTEEELIERLPVAKKTTIIAKPPTYAYAPMYPYDKKEQWYAYMMERMPKGTRFLGFKKVATFDREESITMYMRMDKPGLHTYAVHLACDSYLGCDKLVQFQINVGKTPPVKEEEEDEEDSDDEEEEETEMSPIWDYIVLVLLAVFAYNWLVSKGYWAQYVTPVWLKLLVLFQPITDKVYPVIAPVWDPMVGFISSSYDYVGNMLTRNPPPPNTDDFDY